jgi:hypothetical protein
MAKLTEYIRQTRATPTIVEAIKRTAEGEHFTTEAEAIRWLVVNGAKATGYWPENPFVAFLSDIESEAAT